MTNEDAIRMLVRIKERINFEVTDAQGKMDALNMAIKALEQQEKTAAMTRYTDGLEEGIRCAMCTNPMANDRGCDGGCVVNESMYQNVLNVIKKQILEQQPCEDWYDVPSNEMTLEQARQAVKDLRKKLAEYLEQQPCEDAVSRQAVLDSFWKLDTELRPSAIDAIVNMINNLPSVTPKQEPCEDCISREAVNDGFKKYENGSFAYGCVWSYINNLPSVTPKEKTEWIPVKY